MQIYTLTVKDRKQKIMEQIPKVEEKETEKRTSTDVIADIERLKTELSEEEQTKVFNLKADKEVKEEVVVETPKAETFAKELSPETTMIAQTLMATASEKAKDIYADVDFSGILKADLNLLQKVTLMETVIVPNAKKMANIEKNLKSNDAEDTPTEKKSGEFSKPSTSGKVDEKAGETLYTEMSERLGLTPEFNDEKEKSE
jgi:hypothetical protein